MISKDIIVGRHYLNTDNGDILLGIGNRKMWTGSLDNTGEMESKHLVIILTKETQFLGLILKEDEDCIAGIWDGIKLL